MNRNTQPPRQPLGFFPTPLVDLKRLTAHLGGPRLLIKRDDQSGLALGGNKTRKLEYFMGQALAGGFDTVVTGGAQQSNHCRQTAAAAAACGLQCHLVLGGDPPPRPDGNLLLDLMLGAVIHWSGRLRKGEQIPQIAEALRREGRRPLVIPYGGSNALGALGFVTAVEELVAQLEARSESVTHIVFASSSGGTHAGLIAGRALHRANFQVVGIQIDREDQGIPIENRIADLAGEAAALLNIPLRCDSAEVVLQTGYLGGGYGVVGPLEEEAISLMARWEGILLDPVYTGRAMGGLLDGVRKGVYTSRDTVLFWHTGGTPSLFHHRDSEV